MVFLFEVMVRVVIRDVRGGAFSSGAGRGGARMKIRGVGRGEDENPRGSPGRGKKSAQINWSKDSTKVRKLLLEDLYYSIMI